MKKITIGLLMLCSTLVFSQEDALVFFADKENVADALANPLTILTQDALDRKQLHGTPIDERDVPVTPAYVSEIKDQSGITVYAKSKWMNSVYVRGSQANIENLLDLSFVEEIEFLNDNLNFSPPISGTRDKFEIENKLQREVYDYGMAANQVEMISADYLHEQDFTGAGIVVAVLDSGFPNITTIPGFSVMINEGRLLGTYDFVLKQETLDNTSSHGTRVLSDMAAIDEGQLVGTAPGASYYLYRTEDTNSENPVEEAYWVEALERADSLGVYVTNTSLGYQDFDDASYDHDYEDLDGQTTIAARGANHAFDKGMLLVTSAGNDGNGFGFVATPADAPGVLTVGAVDANENYASFSSFGPTSDGRIKPDVMAQGEDAAVIGQFGDVVFNNGTSFASPIMAGAVASLWQARPQTTNAELMQIVREASSMFENPSNTMGYGIPNFEEALTMLQQLDTDEFLLENEFGVYPNPVQEYLSVSFPKNITSAELTLMNVLGETVLKTKITNANNRVEVSKLTSGVYIAAITSEGKTNSFKIIKR
ncbi:S8 family serine peptidase [Flavobacteriaceae bacterium TK19130]|nr:S8 family serine peptidase [Thermobacterium salinum]